MSESSTNPEGDEMLPEYDLTGGVRGKYAERYAEETNVIVLDPDVAAVFKTAAVVNAVLREHLKKTAGGGA